MHYILTEKPTYLHSPVGNYHHANLFLIKIYFESSRKYRSFKYNFLCVNHRWFNYCNIPKHRWYFFCSNIIIKIIPTSINKLNRSTKYLTSTVVKSHFYSGGSAQHKILLKSSFPILCNHVFISCLKGFCFCSFCFFIFRMLTCRRHSNYRKS